MTNTNPETGIRYGIISALDLHQEIIDELQAVGKDVHWEEMLEEVRDRLRSAIDPYVSGGTAKELIEDWIEQFIDVAGDSWYDDEPVHEGAHCGVNYSTTWIGGALHVWVFDSPHTGLFAECSPCVPCAGSLGQPDENGILTYDVPPEWRWADET